MSTVFRIPVPTSVDPLVYEDVYLASISRKFGIYATYENNKSTLKIIGPASNSAKAITFFYECGKNSIPSPNLETPVHNVNSDRNELNVRKFVKTSPLGLSINESKNAAATLQKNFQTLRQPLFDEEEMKLDVIEEMPKEKIIVPPLRFNTATDAKHSPFENPSSAKLSYASAVKNPPRHARKILGKRKISNVQANVSKRRKLVHLPRRG